MVTVSEVLGGHAAPHVFEHGGRRYKVGLITQAVKSAYERWLIDRALAAAGEHALAISVVTRDVAKGVYGYHGKVAAESWAEQDGIVKLASLLFGTTEADMVDLLTARPVEVKNRVLVAILESTPAEHRERVLARMQEAGAFTDGKDGGNGAAEGELPNA